MTAESGSVLKVSGPFTTLFVANDAHTAGEGES